MVVCLTSTGTRLNIYNSARDDIPGISVEMLVCLPLRFPDDMPAHRDVINVITGALEHAVPQKLTIFRICQ